MRQLVKLQMSLTVASGPPAVFIRFGWRLKTNDLAIAIRACQF